MPDSSVSPVHAVRSCLCELLCPGFRWLFVLSPRLISFLKEWLESFQRLLTGYRIA
jgi:hypothetical protein